MKKTVAIIENKRTGVIMTHIRKSNGVVAVTVVSEYEDCFPEYFEKKPTLMDNFKQTLKTLHN